MKSQKNFNEVAIKMATLGRTKRKCMDNNLQEKMHIEALKRLELLEASAYIRVKFLDGKKLTKSDVDVDNCAVYDRELTDDEIKMVHDFEQSYSTLVYYVIKDTALWPDGCKFMRYTFLYVSSNEEEWELDKEESIQRCGTVPAYVINMEDQSCSEITEFAYANVSGMLINVS